MTAGTTQASTEAALTPQETASEVSPLYASIKSRLLEVCGTGAHKLRLRSETVRSASIVEQNAYRIGLTTTRTTRAGGVPADVETVPAADFARKVDNLHTQYQRRLASTARSWLENMAPKHGNVLTGDHFVASPPRYGYAQNCNACAGEGSLHCTHCKLTGSERCDACRGSGTLACTSCHGSQRIKCTACFGMRGQQVYGTRTEYNYVSEESFQVATSEFVDCFLCLGSGTGRCYACSGGQCPCTGCGASGLVTCHRCRGSKRTGCQACERHGVVTAIGSIACVVEPDTVRQMAGADDLRPVVKRAYDSGRLAPLLHFSLVSSSLDNNTLTTCYEATFEMTVAEVVFDTAVLPRSFYVRAFGPECTLVDYDGLLEEALQGDLETVANASNFHAYFSGKKRLALEDALSAVMLLDVHRASVSPDDSTAEGAGFSTDRAYREKATQVLHGAIRRLSSIHQCRSLLAGVGASLAVLAIAVLALHSLTIAGWGYGAAASVLTWLGLDVYRRFRLRRILGVSTYRRALGANAAQLHLQAHPIVLLVLTGMALAGLARVLPGDGVGHEARQVLAALKSTLPVLDDARLDALAHPPSTTFIENQAVFIAEIDALERTAGAGAGNAKALALLGRAYIYGIGVPVDLAEADRLITRAESLDSSTATAARAFYNVEKTHPKNTRMTGVATLKLLAAAGDIDANLYLGLMLDSQQEPVFTRNPREAKRYLDVAAAAGSAIAAEQLATMLARKRATQRR